MFSVRIAALGLIAFAVAFNAGAQRFLDKDYGVQVITDVVYDSTHGLTLDVYRPTGADVPAIKPGFIMVHGGAWILGDKDDSTFENPLQAGDFSTPMQEFASEFAKRGYVCVNINYRQFDDPNFGSYTSSGLLAAANITPITNTLNGLLGPSSVTEATTRKELELAVEDTLTAINWLIANANTYGIDTSRIAVGGYSAGAFNSLLAGYVGNAPVAAIWSNSGSLGGGGNEALYLDASDSIPAILFHGDADAILPFNTYGDPLRAELIAENIPHEYYAMTGEDHYYLRTLVVTDSPDRDVPDTQENLLADFMYDQMSLDAIPVAMPASSSIGLLFSLTLLSFTGALILLRSLRTRRRMATESVAQSPWMPGRPNTPGQR